MYNHNIFHNTMNGEKKNIKETTNNYVIHRKIRTFVAEKGGLQSIDNFYYCRSKITSRYSTRLTKHR